MVPKVLYAGDPADWLNFEAPLRAAIAATGLEVDLSPTCEDPGAIDYIIYAPNSQVQDFTPFTQLKAVLNLWAGVEGVQGNNTLKAPLCRMVEDGMTMGMAEWVLGHVMRHHLGMDRHILGQDGIWRNDVTPPLARGRKIGILGLGALGQASAALLSGVGFQVHGWSRSQKDILGVTCYAGEDGLARLLATAEILVLLLPLTTATKGVINAQSLAKMPKGAVLINPGRGGLIDTDALLAALDSGQLSQATLDVFEVEPLPKSHDFWGHAKVTVTPHIASATRPETAAETIAENIRRGEAGERFLHIVDRRQGY